MKETTEKQTLRIDLNFSATLGACPDCEHKQDMSQNAECRKCGYHAGAELAEQWTDYVAALNLPAGCEIEDTYLDESDCWIEISVDVDAADTGSLADIWKWVEDEGGKIDWDYSDGPLFVHSMIWLRLPCKLNCGLPTYWEQRDETELRAMLDSWTVFAVEGGWKWMIYESDSAFRTSETFATHDEADADCTESITDYEEGEGIWPEAIANTDDESVCEWAIKQAAAGESVWVGHDDDGYYFAEEVL